MLKTSIAGPTATTVKNAAFDATVPAIRWTLANHSLSMLPSSLGTSIVNVGLPTIKRAFKAPFK